MPEITVCLKDVFGAAQANAPFRISLHNQEDDSELLATSDCIVTEPSPIYQTTDVNGNATVTLESNSDILSGSSFYRLTYERKSVDFQVGANNSSVAALIRQAIAPITPPVNPGGGGTPVTPTNYTGYSLVAASAVVASVSGATEHTFHDGSYNIHVTETWPDQEYFILLVPPAAAPSQIQAIGINVLNEFAVTTVTVGGTQYRQYTLQNQSGREGVASYDIVR